MLADAAVRETSVHAGRGRRIWERKRAFLRATHGADDNFVSCVWDSNDPDNNEILWDLPIHYPGGRYVTVAVDGKTLDQPPFNFVFLNACETAGITGTQQPYLADAFGVNANDVDRVFIGWNHEVFASRYVNQEWNSRFWHNMLTGDNVGVAASRSSQYWWPQGEQNRGDSHVVIDVSPIFIGDTRTKVHGVYRGSGTDWYR